YDHLVTPLAARDDTVLIDAAGREIAGRVLYPTTRSLAAGLAGLGLSPGDRDAVQGENTSEVLALHCAGVAAGIVFLPRNTAYTADEVEYFVSDAEAALLVGDPSRTETLSQVAQRHGARFETLDAAGKGSLVDLAAGTGGRFAPAARTSGD